MHYIKKFISENNHFFKVVKFGQGLAFSRGYHRPLIQSVKARLRPVKVLKVELKKTKERT